VYVAFFLTCPLYLFSYQALLVVDTNETSASMSGMFFLGFDANLLSFEKFGPFDLKTSFPIGVILRRGMPLELLSRPVFVHSWVGSSSSRFFSEEAASSSTLLKCFFSDSRGWEVILEVWEDTW